MIKIQFKRAIAAVVLSTSLLAPSFVFAQTNANLSIDDYNSFSYVKSDGTYWTWGSNRAVPTQIVGIDHIEKIVDNEWLVKKDGSVWLLGQYNSSGVPELIEVKEAKDISLAHYYYAIDSTGQVIWADRSQPNQVKPVVVDTIKDVVDISMVYIHELSANKFIIVKADGTVWTSDIDFTNVKQIEGMEGIKQVEAFAALDNDGAVWELDVTDETITNSQPFKMKKIAISAAIQALLPSDRENYLAIDTHNYLWYWGYTRTGYSDGTVLHEAKPVQFKNLTNIKQAVQFERTIAALTDEGRLYTTSTSVSSISKNAEFELLAENVKSLEVGYDILFFKQRITSYGATV